MSQKLIEEINRFQEDSKVTLKQLRDEVRQEISCRLHLLNYKDNDTLGVLDGSYSVYSFDGNSGVNTPYTFTVKFISDQFIHIEDIVDTDVHLQLTDIVNPLVKKSIYGKIFDAKEDSIVARKFIYEIQIVSPLYYLGLNNKYEIFHEKKTSDIILEIINRYAQLLNLKIDVKLDLVTAPIREYTTQYNQSDLEFILMLCESEGYSLIVDYSSNDPYTLTLCELNEHSIIKTYSSTCSFNHAKKFTASHIVEDYFDKDRPSLQYKSSTGSVMHSSVNENQSTSQLRTDIKRENLRDKLNILDESLFKDLKRYNTIEAQRQFVQTNTIQGNSEELNIQDCLCIDLEDEKANKKIESIILEVKYKGFFPNALDEYKQNINETKKRELEYEIDFVAIPKDITYKPPLKTPKPKIPGVLTAIVSNGNANTKDYHNTIDVDEQGRIKVLFHFETNQTSSCYLRLSNFYSGEGFGSQFLPRVNSEVIVSFINGDPDLPIIIGTLHNGENKNPYNLPKEKTKSFIRTNSIPQYEDKIGYNEIAFEDKRGDENLSFRAQKDMNTLVLNDSFTHIQNNSKSIIDNDKEETVESNSTLTVNKDYSVNVKENHINTVEKEKITTVQEDYEIHSLKDINTIVKNDMKSIIEHDMITRVKGTSKEYIEQDVKKKYLQNFFHQVGKDFRLDVQDNYHLKSNNIKLNADIIELIGDSGVTLRCGGHVLTVAPNGILMKSTNVDTTSTNTGVKAANVAKPVIKKPLYEKIRVIELIPSITKQNDIKEVLTYTARVEKYQNDAWSETTELNETQLSQLQWYFIKNNDESDRDIITDNPTNDIVTINGLTMTINIQEDNIYKWGHAHCYVVNSETEGYTHTYLQRYLEVTDIVPIHIPPKDGQCTARFNVDEIRPEELVKVRWTVEGREESKYNGKNVIVHNLKEENVHEINFTAYFEGKPEDAANARLTYDEKKIYQWKIIQRKEMNLKKLILLALSLFIFSGCANSNDPQPEEKQFIKSNYDIDQCNKESYTQNDLNQYQQLIKDGEIQGYNCVGLYYMRQKKYQKAEEYFNQGKEKGSIESYALLGSLYSHYYDKKDDAIYYYLDAAEHGHAKSMHNLGVIFDQRFNYETALEWYNKSYATGDTYSLLAIGTIYLKQKKLQKAIETFEKVGQLGDSNGYYNLGILYKNNTEIKNYTKSKEYFHKCLDLGNIDCAGAIGTVFENEKNYNKAIEWYKKGFSLGSAGSAQRLGFIYDDILKDYKKAIYWYTKGYELGSINSANNLGYLYHKVYNNYQEAKKWYEKAIKLGSNTAINNLRDLEKENE